MKPSVRLHNLIVTINYYAKVLGLELLAPKKQFSARTLIPICAILFYMVFGVQWAVKEGRKNWMDGLKTSIMLGGLINGSMEILTVILKHDPIKSLLIYTENIYAEYEVRGPAYCKALNFGINRMLKIRQIIQVGYIVSFFVMIAVPWVVLFFKGTRTTIMQYEIPGLPLENNLGYLITYLQQMASASVGGFGFYTGDLMVLLALVQILMFARILDVKATTLNEALQRKEKSRYNANVGEYVEHDTEALLLDLIKWHQLFTDYCHHAADVYHNMLAAQVLSSAISVLVCFCVNLNGFHLISTIYLIISAYSMLVYCIVGTQIEYAYDQVYENICSISWYELSCYQRKLFALMMKESQNADTMMMMGILPLSIRTALQISKLIYSISMMMMRT